MHVEITFLRAFLIAEHNFGVFSFYTFFDIFIFEEKNSTMQILLELRWHLLHFLKGKQRCWCCIGQRSVRF